MKATERHQLKENQFATTTLRVVGSLQENRSRVGTVVIAAVVVIGLIGGVFFWRTHKANQAGAALGVAMATASAPVAPASTLPGVTQAAGTFPSERARTDAAIAAFTDVTTRFSGTDAAIAAEYHLATEIQRAGRPEDAIPHFQAVIDSGSTLYAPVARLGMAEALLGAGKSDEAIAALTALAAERDGLVPTDAALMELGRAQLKIGHPDEARGAFKRIVDEFPTSTYLSAAQTELNTLD